MLMSRKTLVWLGCAVMLLGGGYLLWTNGYRNVVSYAMLLLCPIMHLVMHRGHTHSDTPNQETVQTASDGSNQTGNKPACH